MDTAARGTMVYGQGVQVICIRSGISFIHSVPSRVSALRAISRQDGDALQVSRRRLIHPVSVPLASVVHFLPNQGPRRYSGSTPSPLNIRPATQAAMAPHTMKKGSRSLVTGSIPPASIEIPSNNHARKWPHPPITIVQTERRIAENIQPCPTAASSRLARPSAQTTSVVDVTRRNWINFAKLPYVNAR